MSTEINEVAELAYEGSAPLTTTPTVGTPSVSTGPTLTPTTEPVRGGEIRVTILGSGDPFEKKSHASASLLICGERHRAHLLAAGLRRGPVA